MLPLQLINRAEVNNGLNLQVARDSELLCDYSFQCGPALLDKMRDIY